MGSDYVDFCLGLNRYVNKQVSPNKPLASSFWANQLTSNDYPKMNKIGSIELSTDALVTIVLALVFLMLGLFLIGKIFGDQLCFMTWCPFK